MAIDCDELSLTWFSQREQMNSQQQLAMEQLLFSGLGTYQQILSRLELDFGVPLIGIVDVALT